MAAIPNVHIEWEWRGRTIRNMSLMTFGRQMYLIRESHSPAGVTMSILPMDEAIAAAAAEAVAAAAAANQTDVNASDEDDLRDQQSLKASRFIQKRSVISHQSHHRKPRHTLSDDETYKRTSTLYIMNALEKDSGRYVDAFVLFTHSQTGLSTSDVLVDEWGENSGLSAPTGVTPLICQNSEQGAICGRGLCWSVWELVGGV